MTPEDPESRRIAEELERRERRRPGSDASLDPATLAALLEKHEGEVTRIIGQAEAALAERIDTLVNSQGAAAEGLRREISETMKGDRTEEIAALERRLREDQRSGLETLSKNLKQGLEALKASLDAREGGVFAGIDGVAENVKPAADALRELQQAVAGTAAAARDVAAIREAVVDSRQAVDEVVIIRKTVANSDKAIADVVAMRPVLRSVVAGLETWGTNTRRLRRFGLTLLVVLSLMFCAAGVWLQRETGIWQPTAGSDDYWRDLIWERYRAQIVPCIRAGLTHERGMSCTFGDMDP